MNRHNLTRIATIGASWFSFAQWIISNYIICFTCKAIVGTNVFLQIQDDLIEPLSQANARLKLDMIIRHIIELIIIKPYLHTNHLTTYR